MLNSNIHRVDLTKRNKDVVGKIKVSAAQNIYDADFEYGKQPLRWEEYTAEGGTITHLPGVGGCALFLPGNSPAAITIRQSRPYHRYQPGKSMYMATALQLGAANLNQIQRFGFFDDGNGMFFEQSVVNAGNPAGMYCVVRSDVNYSPNAPGTTLVQAPTIVTTTGSTSATVTSASGLFVGQKVVSTTVAANTYVAAISGLTVTLSQPATGTGSQVGYFFTTALDLRVDYANWSDPQGIKTQIDWTKIQMFWMEYAWYGAGCLRWGVLINGEPFVLHEIGAGNNGSYGGGVLSGVGAGAVAWSRTGNLPVRYEQRNVGASTSNTMYHYGVSVMMEGGADPQRGFTYSYGMTPLVPRRYVPPNSARYPVLSIQPRVMGIQEVGTYGGLADASTRFTAASGTASGAMQATLSATRTLPQVTRFTVSGSTTTIQFRKAHGLSSGAVITLADFAPSGLNIAYTATYASPSTLTIPNATAATAIGTATASGVSLATNQLVGRAFYYQAVDGLFYMSKIVESSASTINFVDATSGDATPAPETSTGTISGSVVAGSSSINSTWSGPIKRGWTINSPLFPAGTTVVSVPASSPGAIVVSAPAIASGTPTFFAYPTFYIGQINRGQLLPQQLLVSSDSLCVVELVASTPGNPVSLTNSNFQQLATLGSPNSFSSRDVSATSLAGGEVVNAFTAPAGGSGIITIDLENLFPLYNSIAGATPDTLTVAVSTKAAQVPSPAVSQFSVVSNVGYMSFVTPHNLNAGDSVVLTGFEMRTSGGTNSTLSGTYTVASVTSEVDITLSGISGTFTASVVGSVTLLVGANVGAHLICQEAMS